MKKDNRNTLSLITLEKMEYIAQDKNVKFYISGYIKEPLLKSTGKIGFDFHFAYHFIDTEKNEYILKKDEALKLVSKNLTLNAKINSSRNGFNGINCDLRDLKEIIPSSLESYLSKEEIDLISNQLDSIAMSIK